MSIVFRTRGSEDPRTGRAVWWCGAALLAVLLASGGRRTVAENAFAETTADVSHAERSLKVGSTEFGHARAD